MQCQTVLDYCSRQQSHWIAPHLVVVQSVDVNDWIPKSSFLLFLLIPYAYVLHPSQKNASCRGVTVNLEDGGKIHADVLVGADGIWSQVKMRTQM